MATEGFWVVPLVWLKEMGPCQGQTQALRQLQQIFVQLQPVPKSRSERVWGELGMLHGSRGSLSRGRGTMGVFSQGLYLSREGTVRVSDAQAEG